MDEPQIDEAALKEAFKPSNKPLKISIAVFIIGLLTLVGGITFTLINFLTVNQSRDAEYLVEIGAWVRKDEPSVTWNFTEIGKGKLSTNDYLNDYEFIWAIENDRLKLETEWFYELNDEFIYKLDQGNKVLTLKSESGDINFVPAGSVNTEI